jgi:hypothetical protein
MKQNKNLLVYTPKKLYVLLAAFFAFVMFLHSSAVLATVAESFSATADARPGVLVSLSADDPNKVDLASSSNEAKYFGVVTSATASNIVIKNNAKDLYVTSSGETDVLVSGINGDVRKGDTLTLSSIEGVAAKQDKLVNRRIIGVALSDFDAKTAVSYNLQNSKNNESIAVGFVKVRLNEQIVYTNDLKKDKAGIIGFLGDLVGRDISFLRATLSIIAFVLCLLAAAIFMVISLHGSFVSLGRNPLAGAQIFKSLSRMTLLCLGIILIGSAFSYAVLVV